MTESYSECIWTTWANLRGELGKLESWRQDRVQTIGLTFHEPLFRGLPNAAWVLSTTLEREGNEAAGMGFLAYHHLTSRARPTLETLGNGRLLQSPDPFELREALIKCFNDHSYLDMFLSQQRGIYEYLVYLRHNGFPSPLLDWTVSPYVACLLCICGRGKRCEIRRHPLFVARRYAGLYRRQALLHDRAIYDHSSTTCSSTEQILDVHRAR